MKRPRHQEAGQALAEFTIALIGLGVLLMGILLIGELSRARISGVLEARAQAGAAAQAGLLSGTPTWQGMGSAADLQTRILSVMETPIAYAQYQGSSYAYIQNNLEQPLQDPSATLIGAFNLTMVESSRSVTNTSLLTGLGVGSDIITVTERACLPVMKDFP